MKTALDLSGVAAFRVKIQRNICTNKTQAHHWCRIEALVGWALHEILAATTQLSCSLCHTGVWDFLPNLYSCLTMP